MKLAKIFLFSTQLFFFSSSFSQGCSDAGFCTLGPIKTGIASDSLRNTLKVGLNYGKADFDITVIGSYIDYNYKVSEKLNLGTKITYTNQKNANFSAAALSDIFVFSDYKVANKTNVNLGFKIPFSDGNLKNNGIALPMDFQPSLGTFDIVLGVSRKINNFFLALGYQKPLSQNKNNYFKPISESKYFTTNGFERSSDILLRGMYVYDISEKITLNGGLLGIYHTTEDRFVDAIGNKNKIKGSDGLTLNLNLLVNYKINQTNALELSFGSPLIVRESRPDGLTRSMVANLEYKFKF